MKWNLSGWLLCLLALGCGAPSERTFSGSGPLGGAHRSIQVENVVIVAPEDAVDGNIHVTVDTVELPRLLPDGLHPVGPAVDIGIDHPERLDKCLVITFDYDDRGVLNEDILLVLHHDKRLGYEPVTILHHDQIRNRITFESCIFSEFILVDVQDDPPASSDVGFNSALHGWPIDNFENHFSTGMCYGMASYALWFFSEYPTEHLYDHFQVDKQVNREIPSYLHKVLATRAHLAMRQPFFEAFLRDFGSPSTIGRRLKAYLHYTQKPLVLLLKGEKASEEAHSSHAGVVHGYNERSFRIYDPNDKNWEFHLNFDGRQFGAYKHYTHFGFVARPSLYQLGRLPRPDYRSRWRFQVFRGHFSLLTERRPGRLP